MNYLHRFLFFICLIGTFFLAFVPAQTVQARDSIAQQVRSPAFLQVNRVLEEGKNVIDIKGTTPLNTEVLIYIDGSYVDNADIKQVNENTFIFEYAYQAPLETGEHEIMAIAQDKNSGRLSPPNSYEITLKNVDLASCISQDKEAQTPQSQLVVPAPTLVGTHPNKNITVHKPLIKGLTISGTRVHIYIDDELYGSTQVLHHSSGTANFAYEPFLHLKEGKHTVYAVAENKNGEKSRHSEELTFVIEEDHPAPTILAPQGGTTTPQKDLVIKGVTKDNSAVQVYLNHNLAKTIEVSSSNTGTAGFVFKPDDLSRGRHILYLTAISPRGKVSPWSEIITFTVTRPRIGASPQTDSKKDSTSTAPNIQPPSSQKETHTATKTTSTSSVAPGKEVQGAQEEKEEDSSNTTGTTILVALVLLVLAWLLWVNKESLHFKKKNDQQ